VSGGDGNPGDGRLAEGAIQRQPTAKDSIPWPVVRGSLETCGASSASFWWSDLRAAWELDQRRIHGGPGRSQRQRTLEPTLDNLKPPKQL